MIWGYPYCRKPPLVGILPGDSDDVMGVLSKEVLKSNFRQYGEMEMQRWEESERRRKEVRRSERRKK